MKRSINKTLMNSLKSESLWQNKLKADCLKNEVYLALRNEYVDFYYKGGRLFQYDKNGFKTHIKYAAVIDYKDPYLSESELKTCNLASDFESSYERIKENCANYSGVEALGVSSILNKSNYLTENDIVVLDIEVVFEALCTSKKTDRIDLLLFDKKTQKLHFVEAKDLSNGEIRSTTQPKVIKQIEKYEKQVFNNYVSILKCYKEYILDLNLFFGLSLPLPLEIDEKVKLLIFGFDSDQQKGSLQTVVLNKLKGSKIKVKTIGNPKGLKLKTVVGAKVV